MNRIRPHVVKRLVLLLSLVAFPFFANAASTINATNAYTWGANIGWLNWRPSSADGVSIGSYTCSGYIYGANVGWINMGSGNPADHIRYQNNSATDFGVNFTVDPNNSGHGLLRGYAYGANIGWINFENTGNPYVIISNGQLRGYVYSANCGWINLDDLNYFVSTDTIDPGVDSDSNGLPDAWEYTYFGGIGVNPNADPDGDGETNIGEYRGGTDPTDPASVHHSARQLNISTRLRVLTNDDVLIGGFIITGPVAKKVIVRALGPSLTGAGVPGALQDPTLELHDSTGGLIGFNNDWADSQATEIQQTGLSPNNSHESAIVRTLAPGLYTAIVRGAANTIGVGLVEVYDLGQDGTIKLANISSRGFVDTNDNVMIGGFIIGAGLGNNGAGSARVMVRALGPSLASAGIPNPLANPTLELHDGNGALLASNDNWTDSQQTAIQATGLAPQNNFESAILTTLPSGLYTAIVRGQGGTTGVALVEVYHLN